MSFSVGVLYSASDFLKHLNANPISHSDFKASFTKFGVASAEAVLSVSQDCGWVAIDTSGVIAVTERGLRILACGDYTLQLRHQISDLIERYQPTWAKKIPSGRSEAKSSLSKEAEQCFFEAGLLGPWDDDLIRWWDELAQVSKSRKATELLDIGRTAERLSVNYEFNRTGTKPIWQSLESNFSGFDVLSQLEDCDKTPLRIEVKGSTLSRKEAYFTLTRNEWTVACNSKAYCLHLWALSSNPISLAIVDRSLLTSHIPQNLGFGKWETVRIPFSPFPFQNC